MQTTKIQFSAEELTLMNNAAWIIMKNDIIKKMIALMGEIKLKLEEKVLTKNYAVPDACLRYGAKISRGEKYEGLPYVILDYPRLFNKEAVFAHRVLFWWGNFFSSTLHLSGHIKNDFAAPLANHFNVLKNYDFYISVAADEWTHDVSEPHYVPLKKLTKNNFTDLLQQQNFVKISTTYSLSQWEKLDEKMIANFEILMQCLQ